MDTQTENKNIDTIDTKGNCEICNSVKDTTELEYNSKFSLYHNRKICDKCADKIELQADLEL